MMTPVARKRKHLLPFVRREAAPSWTVRNITPLQGKAQKQYSIPGSSEASRTVWPFVIVE